MYVITVPTLNLETVYRSCQSFRWRRLAGMNPKKFFIINGEHAAKVEQFNDRLAISCSDQDFYDVWFRYFDMSTDYADLNFKARQMTGEVRELAMRYNGLHLLNQDPWEALITSQLWFKASPQKVRLMVEAICNASGKERSTRLHGIGSVTWHEFPSPQELMTDLDIVEKVSGSNRMRRVQSVCEAVIGGKIDPWMLAAMRYEDAREDLTWFMHEREADRALLWMGHKCAFPVNDYVEGLATWDYDCEDVDEFKEWHMHDLKGREGYVSALITLGRAMRKGA